MQTHNPDFMLFTGNANPGMASEIAQHLGISLGAAHVGRFSDGEVTGLPPTQPAKRSLVVSPNPIAKGGAWITYRGSENETLALVVYDVLGRRTASLDIPSADGDARTIYWHAVGSRGAPLAPGTYFLRLTSSRGDQATERVVIVR